MDVSLSSNNQTLRDMQSILDFLGSLHESEINDHLHQLERTFSTIGPMDWI